MQNRDIYLMILGMTLVTYLPRVLPAVAVEAVMLLVQGSGMLWSVVVVAG